MHEKSYASLTFFLYKDMPLIDVELTQSIRREQLPPEIAQNELLTHDPDSYAFLQCLQHLSAGTIRHQAHNSRTQLLASALWRYCTAEIDDAQNDLIFRPINHTPTTRESDSSFSPYMSIDTNSGVAYADFFIDDQIEEPEDQILTGIMLPEAFAARLDMGRTTRQQLAFIITTARKAVDYTSGFCNPSSENPEIQARYKATAAEFYKGLTPIWPSERVLDELGEQLVTQFPRGLASLPPFKTDTMTARMAYARRNPLLYIADSASPTLG